MTHDAGPRVTHGEVALELGKASDLVGTEVPRE
jgi:hypothetical protein